MYAGLGALIAAGCGLGESTGPDFEELEHARGGLEYMRLEGAWEASHVRFGTSLPAQFAGLSGEPAAVLTSVWVDGSEVGCTADLHSASLSMGSGVFELTYQWSRTCVDPAQDFVDRVTRIPGRYAESGGSELGYSLVRGLEFNGEDGTPIPELGLSLSRREVVCPSGSDLWECDDLSLQMCLEVRLGLAENVPDDVSLPPSQRASIVFGPISLDTPSVRGFPILLEPVFTLGCY